MRGSCWSVTPCPENPLTQNQPYSVRREDLAAFALGELSPEHSLAVQAAIEGSPKVRAELATIQSTVSLLGEARLFEPPASMVQKALGLVSSPAVQPSWLERAVDSIATLVYDSLATQNLAGFRGSGDTAIRHMTFDSEAGEVDLEIRAPAPGSVSFHVTGQIVPAEAASNIDVGFEEASTGVRGRCTADERGRFQFIIEPGNWDLRFAVGERTLSLPRLNIG